MKNSDPQTKKQKILVVEDEQSICRICLITLSSEGFEVDVAANGSLAEKMLADKSDYDLLLVDIRTPIMNGQQLYQSITEKHPQLAERVVFTTGDVLGGDTKGFLKQSGRLYLPKPFTPDELKTIVMEALKQIENESG